MPRCPPSPSTIVCLDRAENQHAHERAMPWPRNELSQSACLCASFGNGARNELCKLACFCERDGTLGSMVGCGVSVYTDQPLMVQHTTVTTVCETARPATAINTSVTGLVCEIRDRERSGDMVRIEIDVLSSDGPI